MAKRDSLITTRQTLDTGEQPEYLLSQSASTNLQCRASELIGCIDPLLVMAQKSFIALIHQLVRLCYRYANRFSAS